MHGNIAIPSFEAIAHWPKPDYDHGVRRTWLPIYAGCLLAMSTLLTAIRTILRAKQQGGGFGLDDVRFLATLTRID
jgi:hypothetical protein